MQKAAHILRAFRIQVEEVLTRGVTRLEVQCTPKLEGDPALDYRKKQLRNKDNKTLRENYILSS